MQEKEAVAEKSRRVGIDEKLINFRSSPNFKNMKKFLKTRHSEAESYSPPEPQPEIPVVLAERPIKEEINPIHPPLPLDPPPPDSPPAYPKKIEYDDQILEKQCMGNTEKKVPDVCREFLRGTCNRPTCKFRHEYDLSQLRGVYTFCHNYQNNKCTYPNCKFLHATVFEESRFYRTGVLPPHVLNSKLATKLMPPPPPPPPETKPPELKPLSTSSLMPHPPLEKPITLTCVPTSTMVMAQHHSNEMKTTYMDQSLIAQSSHHSPRANWGEIDASAAAAAAAAGVPPPPQPRMRMEHPVPMKQSKCEHCDLMENRLNHTQVKAENMRRCLKDMQDKMADIDKKERRLNAVLQLIAPFFERG